MSIKTNILLDFKENNDLYYSLLKEEDYDFKTKNIKIDVSKSDVVSVNVVCDSILDFKIATNSLVKSLEVIDKTINL